MSRLRLKKAVRLTVPWQFPAVDLPAGTVVGVVPANNIPGRDQYWLHDPKLWAALGLPDNEYGVLVNRWDHEWA